MKKLKNKWFYFSSCLLYIALIFVFFILTIMFLEQYAVSFLISNFAANKNGSQDIIEIVLDDKSVQEYKWPWTKDMYAHLLDYFHTYAKPKVIGFDMNPTSFDENNELDRQFAKQISKMPNLVSGFVPEIGDVQGETNFLEAFSKKYSVDTDEQFSSFPTAYKGVVEPPKMLVDSVKNYGSIKIEKSSGSGSIFSAINLLRIGDSFYPSLPFKMYLFTHNTNYITMDDFTITVHETGLKLPYRTSMDGLAQSYIRYYKRIVYPNGVESDYSHPNISAAVILDTYKALQSGITPQNHPELYDINNGGKYLNPELFRDKVILIGANISGPSADVLPTPMSMRHPGVDIQASVYDNLANNYFLTFAGLLPNFLAFFILSLLTFIFLLRMKFIKGLLSIVAIDVVYLIIVFAFASHGYIMGLSVPLVLQFVTAVFGYSFKFISENRNKEKIKQAMGKYLSQDIMKNVVSNIDDLKLGGKRAIVTVLFSDIRGFTSLSEKMSAEEVSMILNEYFAEMEPIITKYNGVINKFIGDAVMALFGEPIQDINHAQNAVKCAYEMLKKVEYLREKWLYEGKPKIEIGIGINTGEVFIGNIGTETRMEYTVIGDTVNLASRIESYNKVYKTNLLVSSSTYASIADIADVIKISEVQIRGKAKKMNIYEVLRIDKK